MDVIDFNSVPCFWTEIEVEGHNFITYSSKKEILVQYEKGTYQEDLSKIIREGKYDLFVDIGSHVGYFSIIASKYCKSVKAYEASPFPYGVLLYNTLSIDNITCFYKWISCTGDIPKISRNFLHMVSSHDLYDNHKIEVSTLDDELPLSYLNNMKVLIKIDIEGNEVKALQGAQRLLQIPNIHWHIDIHPRHNISNEQVEVFFKHHNYKIYKNNLFSMGVK